MKQLPYGISDYKKLKEEDYYYIDKTMYLDKLESVASTITYFRPRRFGKTLFTSMMFYYYDINSSDLFDALFKDTYVYNKPTDNKNNYYVLKLDFSGMIIDKENINDIEQQFIEKVVTGIDKFIDYYGLNIDIDYNGRANQIILRFLSKFERLFLDKKLYVIIDEYDKFTNAILEGNADLFKSILGKNGFVRAFYEPLKEYSGMVIDRIFITGVCSVSLDAMTSGFNIATNITNKKKFNAMTALTHKEVRTIVNDVVKEDSKKIFKIMKDNYDGYKFSAQTKEKVFNPSLVMYFLREYLEEEDILEELMDYNILSNYKQIESIIKLNYNQYYNNILLEVINNKKVGSKLKRNFELDTEFRRDDIISMLYYFGYLTIDSFNKNKKEYNFIIPNKIMTEVFNNYFNNLLMDSEIEIDNVEVFMAIKEMAELGKIDSITNIIRDTLNKFSNRMYIGFSERVIQSMYLMLLKYNNVFRVFDELEVYEGYVDLILFGDNKLSNYDIMIELKYIKKDNLKDSTIEYVLTKAKEQVEKYDKDDRIKSRNKKMLKYVVIFVGDEYKIYEI